MCFITNYRTQQILFCNFSTKFDVSNESIHVQNIYNGKFAEFFKGCLMQTIRNEGILSKVIIDYFDRFDTEENHLEIFCTGIASLFIFIHINWNGGSYDSQFQLIQDNVTNDIKKEMSINGEDINDNVRNPEYLVLANYIFDIFFLKYDTTLTRIWNLRMLAIRQAIFDERSELLSEVLDILTTDVNIDALQEDSERASYFIESSLLHLLYGRVSIAEQNIQNAKDLLGISLSWSGDMGKRTHYQQKSVAQIRLHLNVSQDDANQQIEEKLPELTKLVDEVRMESIVWDSGDVKQPTMSALQQAVLLAEVVCVRKSLPIDELSKEQTLPIVDCVLLQHCCWSARVAALVIKCKMESSHARTMERALRQCERLILNVRSITLDNLKTFDNFWAVSVPPIWKLEKQLADIFLSMGFIKAALDSYLKLQLWESVIVCYTILQQRHKAAEIIQQEIDKAPTVKLLCLLGDATDDVTCYERAWELSEQKSARPYRHWGQYLFGKKLYAECIPYLQKTLSINSLQAIVWLRLGYAALRIENWEVAANAYRHYTSLEPNSFEAWNNLARVYVAQGDKKRAHKAFSEALKIGFENWQVWDNLMVVSIDTGHFDDVIRSYHRLLDLKGKHLDVEVLALLVNAVLKDLPDYDGKPGKRLLKRCLELLGRITAIYPNEYKPWHLYASLTDDAKLRLQRLQRANRSLVNGVNWVNEEDKYSLVLNLCIELGQCCIEVNDPVLMSSVKLTLRSILTTATAQPIPKYMDLLNQCQVIVENLTKQ